MYLTEYSLITEKDGVTKKTDYFQKACFAFLHNWFDNNLENKELGKLKTVIIYINNFDQKYSDESIISYIDKYFELLNQYFPNSLEYKREKDCYIITYNCDDLTMSDIKVINYLIRYTYENNKSCFLDNVILEYSSDPNVHFLNLIFKHYFIAFNSRLISDSVHLIFPFHEQRNCYAKLKDPDNFFSNLKTINGKSGIFFLDLLNKYFIKEKITDIPSYNYEDNIVDYTEKSREVTKNNIQIINDFYER